MVARKVSAGGNAQRGNRAAPGVFPAARRLACPPRPSAAASVGDSRKGKHKKKRREAGRAGRQAVRLQYAGMQLGPFVYREGASCAFHFPAGGDAGRPAG